MKSSSNSFEAEYAVYKLYQTVIHGDKKECCTREQFIRFLVDTPLKVSFYFLTNKIFWVQGVPGQDRHRSFC